MRAKNVLQKAVHDDCDRFENFDRASLTKTFNGYCGLAQCMIGLFIDEHFDRQSVKIAPFASQSLENWWFGHAAVVVSASEGKDVRSFIIDPTFVQFVEAKDIGIAGPIQILQRSEEGAALAKKLSETGVAEIDATFAELYASAFCQGVSSFQCPEDALQFLRNPPQHPYHFSYSGSGTMYDAGMLRERGYTISTNQSLPCIQRAP
jgi:hypothetical protein